MSAASIGLRLGPLGVAGRPITRSGMRWLCDNGQLCRRNEIIAFCNIGFEGPSHPLAEEARDLQVAFATPVAGRVYHAPTFGGFQDFQPVFFWNETDLLARIEPVQGTSGATQRNDARIFMMAGRRVTELAEERSGLLTGWHDRSRVSHADGVGPIATLLSLGICELEGVIRGVRGSFLEMLSAIEGPAQIVFVPDRSLVPMARVIAEQIRRTDSDREAIAEDLAATLAGGKVLPTAADWMFAGALLRALHASPVTERYAVLTRSGFQPAGPPAAIILSIKSEKQTVLRHRKLGYTLSMHEFLLKYTGRAFGPWLKANFDSVRLTVDDIFTDYRALIDLIRESAPTTQILICNAMSSDGRENIPTYAPFDSPLGESLGAVRAKDLDLMLYDLTRERDIAIIDADAIAAELGARRCLPDGTHQNGNMQVELRAEILRVLRARGVPGFAAARVN